MHDDETTGIDSDRIHLAQQITELGDRFSHEATMWPELEMYEACILASRQLDELARRVLGTVDPDRARGLLEAHTIRYGQVEGARRFRTAYTTPPNRRPDA